LNKFYLSPWFKQLLKLLVSVGLIFYCLTLIDVKQVAILIREANFLYLSVSFVFILFGTVVIKSIITWYLLSQQHVISYIELIKINLSMRFYTMILPKAVVAGIRWNKYRILSDPKYSFVLVAFEALTALTISALATPLNIKLVSFGICSIFVFFMSILFLFPDSLLINYFIQLFKDISPIAFLGRLIEKWKDTSSLLKISKAKNFWAVFIIGSFSHLLFLVGAYYLFLALDVDISFAAVAWIRSAVFIFVSIPISLAGVGIREVGFIALFGLYGLQPDVILAYAMLALIIQFAIGFIGVFTELEYWFRN